MNALKDIHPIPGSPALSHINSDAESSSVVGYFEMTKNGQVLSSFSISLGKAYVLGRSEDCDLTLDDRAISRQHVMVEYDESQQCVKVSKKSEFARLLINGLECFEGVMKSNDTMVLGPYQLRFVLKQKEIISVKEAEAKPVVIQKMDSKADQNRELASDANLQELNSNPAGAYTHSIEDPFGIETAMQDAESPNVDSLNAESLAEVVNLNDHKIDDHAEEDENIQQDHDQGLAVSDDATKVLKKAVTAQLVLIQGSANHEVLKLKNNEMIIGRGKQCQLIVDDKKASRKNTKITREGNRFIVEDLNSSNGTYVNQEKINGPHELSGGDVIRIGQVELRFEAEQRDYANQVANFEPITAEALPVAHDEVESFSGLDSMSMEQPLVDGMIPGAFDSESADLNPEVSGKKQSLIDKYIRNFKTLPTKKKLIVGAVIALLVYGFIGEDPQPVKKKSAKVDPKTGQVLKAQARTFESLSEKDKQFVIDQHAQQRKPRFCVRLR
jgi:pSer/pThr/pTyr-binding forkhead associated (FHA) protein